MHACVAVQCAESMAPVRRFLAAGLDAADRAIAHRFSEAVTAGELPADFPVEQRARMATDLMQALALRARAGASGHLLDQIAASDAEAVIAASS